jgi:hypothetical protein
LIPEDDNSNDDKSVRVEICGRVVGHLDRQNAREFRQRTLEAGFGGYALWVKARIRGGWYRGPEDEGHFGVTLDVPTAE